MDSSGFGAAHAYTEDFIQGPDLDLQIRICSFYAAPPAWDFAEGHQNDWMQSLNQEKTYIYMLEIKLYKTIKHCNMYISHICIKVFECPKNEGSEISSREIFPRKTFEVRQAAAVAATRITGHR